MEELTLVTCWWDLEARGAEKGRRDFEKLSRPVLGLNLPMVIYCDPWVADKIAKIRSDTYGGRAFSTHIVSMRFEATEAVKLWGERIKTCELPKKRNVPKDTHMFFNMGWGKPLLMDQVAKLNPFNTPVIGWIDLAISHPNAASEESIGELAHYKWDGDPRVRLHALRCFHGFPERSDFYQAIWGLIAAGFMVGSPSEITKFAEKFRAEVGRVLEGGHATIDEELLASLANREPEAYTYSYGNYCDILRNHQGPIHNRDYLRWMMKDAHERGFTEFGADLARAMDAALKMAQERRHAEEVSSFEQEASKPEQPKRNLIKLHMIVKNEARRIRETLESTKDAIDSWSIMDTGSTDGTQDIIREVMRDIPGELHDSPITTYSDTGVIDYAATRNDGLSLAGTDSEFLLLLNGDDILKSGPALREFCEKATGDCYHMEIKGEGGPSFVYPRLVRPRVGWRYVMPTHEILTGPKPVSGQVSGSWIVKCSDPLEVRLARWAKDQIVLEAWLRDHPDDHRTLFYLAQTHECLSCSGDRKDEHRRESAELYEKRGGLGGWKDEAYESYMRAANNKSQLGDPWPEIQELLLRAHGQAPYRSEPLLKLAGHWVDAGLHAVAYPFAKRAAEIPLPTRHGPINADSSLYEVEVFDMLSRAAYYIGEKAVGRDAARRAAQARPDDIRLRRNFHFYAQKLSDLLPTQEFDIAPPLEPGWYPSTPSVCVVNGPHAIVRAVNYKIRADGSYDYDGTIRTRNYLVQMNEQYRVELFSEIVDRTNVLRTDFPVHGFEDCRLFSWGDRLWAVATVRDVVPEGICVQALLRMGSSPTTEMSFERMTLLKGPWSGKHQKNWKPAATKERINWIYSTDPLNVISHAAVAEGDTAGMTDAHSGRLLGSSQAIQLPSGSWIWIDHEVSYNPQGRERIYVHRLVMADSTLSKVLAMSDPFHFHELGIEFCAGLAINGDDAILSFSVRDASAKLAVVPLKGLLALLRWEDGDARRGEGESVPRQV